MREGQIPHPFEPFALLDDQFNIRRRDARVSGPPISAERHGARVAQLPGRDVATCAQDAHLALDHIELDHWPRSARS